MCPETSTLSAYYDDELNEAQRAAVEAHLESCTACRHVVDGYRGLTHTLAVQEEIDVVAPAARSKPHIETRVALGGTRTGLFGRTVSLPAPVAVLGALIIVMLSAGLVASLDSGAPTRSVVSGETTVLEDIVEFLESRRPAEPVTFTLPEHAQLRVVSEPKFMPAGEYRVLQ